MPEVRIKTFSDVSEQLTSAELWKVNQGRHLQERKSKPWG